jgi:hypothetical protein
MSMMIRSALTLISFLGLATAGAALLSAQAPGPSLSEQQRSLLSAREPAQQCLATAGPSGQQ